MASLTDLPHLPNPLATRKADHDVLSVFVERWSPRAMSGEPLADAELMRIFEAGRWAPSSYNEQEWRFPYAKRDTPHFETFMKCLAEPNQAWCVHAAVLVAILSKKTFTRSGKPNKVHTFDAGLASQNMALQAASMGLVGHGMAGFDEETARRELKVPDDFAVEAFYAFGHPGDPDAQLPEDFAKADKQVSDRRPLAETICEGPFSL